jgi:phosphotransferase system  glucose/maltose/N-acetylglucosamine-specific IIC component
MANTDAPLATVPLLGLSEVVLLVTLIGSALTALFGHDWGITANSQTIAAKAVVLLPIGLAIARAIKHHGASTANAAVAAASPSTVPVETDSGYTGRHESVDAAVGSDLPTVDLTGGT